MQTKQISRSDLRARIEAWPDTSKVSSFRGYPQDFRTDALKIVDDDGPDLQYVWAADACIQVVDHVGHVLGPMWTKRFHDVRASRVFLERTLFEYPIGGYFGYLHFVMALEANPSWCDRISFDGSDALARLNEKVFQSRLSKTEVFCDVMRVAGHHLLRAKEIAQSRFAKKAA